MARTLDARGAIIHQYDPQTRELRIIGVDGPNAEDLLGSIANVDEDFIATNVLCSSQTMTVRVDGELPELAPQRLRALGTSRSIVAVPIMSGARLVALIELVDVDERCEQIIAEVCNLLHDQLLRVESTSS